MKRPLPLNQLRAFERAAFHSSFKLAADELCVTPAAVSQMIKRLEGILVTRLFDRVNRGVYLTAAGWDLAHKIWPLFQRLDDVMSEIERKRRPIP